METIEERAKEYAKIGATLFMESPEEDGIYWDDLARAYTAGAKSEHDMLTKWNDPKEEMPEYYKAVEIKYRRSGLSRISIAWVSAGDAGGYLWTIDGTDVLVNTERVIGWREIPE